ncbi:hypothetical protein KR032_000276, partial [Drosophila birchii]
FVISCLLVIIGSLVWTTSAEQDFESDRDRVIEAYKDAHPDSISDTNIVFLLNFLDKYAGELQLSPEQRSKVDNLVNQYREEKAKQPLVDGAPPQGGWFTKFIRAAAAQIGVDLVIEGIKKATGA